MRKTRRNPETLSLDIIEYDTDPFPKRRRLPPNVDGDVENLTPNNAHEFTLRLANLKVKSSQDIRLRSAMIVLNELGWKPGSRKLILVERLEKEPSGVFPNARSDKDDFLKRRSRYFHVSPSAYYSNRTLSLWSSIRESAVTVN